MFAMTADVARMFLQRSLRGGTVTELLGVACFGGSVISAVSLMIRPTKYEDSNTTTNTAHSTATSIDTDVTENVVAVDESESDDCGLGY